MARLPRLALSGQVHHVALIGHGGGPVFIDDADRRAFLETARLAAVEHRVSVHAYALLDTQVQFLATPAAAQSLGLAMQSIGRRYVAAFNRRHGRRGSLWAGRFRNSVLDAQEWLLDAIVHVESLPVSQGIVAAAGDWEWSSAAAHLGRRRDTLLSDHPAYWRIGNTPFDRELAHADLLLRGRTAQRGAALEMALSRGTVLGDARFVHLLASQAARSLERRPRGRPKKSTM